MREGEKMSEIIEERDLKRLTCGCCGSKFSFDVEEDTKKSKSGYLYVNCPSCSICLSECVWSGKE